MYLIYKGEEIVANPEVAKYIEKEERKVDFNDILRNERHENRRENDVS